MKKIGIILIVLVLLLSGCNSKKEEKEIKIVIDGEEIPIDDFLESAEKAIEDSAFGEILTADNEEPVIIDTSELSEDEYRIRSVFEGIMFTEEDPDNGERIFSEDAIFCSIYDSLILIGGYNKPIEDFNSSLLAEKISEISDIKLDYCYLPKYKHTVNMMLYGAIENSKYLMFAGDIEVSQNSNIDWMAVEANSSTSAEEVAALYAQLDGLQLESYILEDKSIYYFSGQEDWYYSKVFTVKDFSTVYLWDYEEAICAVIVPGEHDEENFEYCDFDIKDI